MGAITAKIECTNKSTAWEGATSLSFGPDYADGRNAEWAAATPSLSVSLTVIDSVAERFEVGGKSTLTFTPSDDQSETVSFEHDGSCEDVDHPQGFAASDE